MSILMNKENNVYLFIFQPKQKLCIVHDILIHCENTAFKLNVNSGRLNMQFGLNLAAFRGQNPVKIQY